MPRTRVHFRSWLMLSFLVLLLATVAIACDPGAHVTYVNNTDKDIFVDVNNGGQIRVEPHTKSTQGDLGLDPDPYVVTVTDEQGHVLYHEATTFGEVKKRNQPIIIGESSPSPTPP